ncbi:PP2C family protein-serine/threonine phosphatase [Sanguibacter suaedae]|uniref:SpoIIE family protein phosphatase n=1 Tax=Sanguibacter suaedae TaxID=2795737 RepID=A0A934I429_9MICO|nr:SpoIIE family protein phosphatase [Sanguibacter suaedae]MBI9113851.1 SpoIIE family protein phosphatase [Sanguibacter suaedae]
MSPTPKDVSTFFEGSATTGPYGEAQRLRALQSLDVLDTPREERFDRVTRLAQRVFDVPMVSVTLIDEDRQWRKSFVGLDGPVAQREGAFCDAAIRSSATLVVPDAITDEIFHDNPFVSGPPGVRFYAGHPLEAPGGERVGTLCILDVKPRELTPGENALLRDLAGWVQNELQRDAELERAGAVQRGLLPSRTPDVAGYAFAATCRPARGVGGDFYDWYATGDDLHLSLADVMGKGMAAAIVAATSRAVLRSTSRTPDVGDALTTADEVLSLDLAEVGTFVTCFHARLEPSSGRVTYSDAGHGLGFVLRADGTSEHLRTDGLPLGLGTGDERRASTVTLDPGDRLLCFSDGLVDLFDIAEDALSIILDAAVAAGSAQATMETLAALRPVVFQPDDLTVLVVERLTA